MHSQAIVVIGGGHAGAQLCASLAEAGLGAQVHLVCEEAVLPYQRPPLSKAYLKSDAEPLMMIRSAAWFSEHGITVHLGDPARSIDRAASTVRLHSGATLPYSRLVLATGTRARRLPQLPGGLANVAKIRTTEDARQLRVQLHAAQHVTVLGGGFIGLEVAATARGLGKAVTVLEASPRLLARAVSPEMAAHVLQTHRASGIEVRVEASVGHFEVSGDRLRSLKADSEVLPVDLLVLGVGAEPEMALAQAAGLVCDNGVVVDGCMRTSDPAILAIGDCTSFPAHPHAMHSSGRLRLESVQNANDQAHTALATLQGSEEPYRALPWFWSDQGSMRLQMVGLMPPDGERHIRPGPKAGSFSVLHYRRDTLVCVESVNSVMDHMASRKLIELGRIVPPAVACDPAVPLKTHA